MTGPYHAICGLDEVLPRQSEIKTAVRQSKAQFIRQFSDYVVYPPENQPLISTRINQQLAYHEGIQYTPRNSTSDNSVVCHLGDTFLSLLGNSTDGFYDSLSMPNNGTL